MKEMKTQASLRGNVIAMNIKCSFTAKINGSELMFIIIIHVLENTIMSVHHEMYDK